jgi:uncharacterized membrane protein
MIDWWAVLTNGLWIAGLAMALALFSLADWRASQRGEGPGGAVERAGRSAGLALSLTLVCLGAGLSVSRGWERLLWLLLAAAFGARTGQIWWPRRGGKRGE